MTATYEPGRLYAVDSWRGKSQLAFGTFRSEPKWCVLDGEDTRGLTDEEVTDVRPLVVLDPSEFIAENLVPLLLATAKKGTEGLYARRSAVRFVADQIEAQTRPPKPAEPTGLGAVVEDAKGRRWVLADPENPPSWTLANESDTTWEKYRDIDAVRVLSEGVTA